MLSELFLLLLLLLCLVVIVAVIAVVAVVAVVAVAVAVIAVVAVTAAGTILAVAGETVLLVVSVIHFYSPFGIICPNSRAR